MPRQICKRINGKLVWLKDGEPLPQSAAPSVHQDSMPALRHPKTGEIVESRSKWNRINKAHKLECVGNDLLSNHKREIKEKITEERIIEATNKAEAILSDPFKRNQRLNQNLAAYERAERDLNGQK